MAQPLAKQLMVSTQPDWDDPISILRKKWGTLPSSVDGRQDSATLLNLSDADLLANWELIYRRDHDDLNIRGWYHELYRNFMVGKKVLDIGCGLALSTIPFAQMGAHVTFVDIVPENVALVKRLCDLKNIEARFLSIECFFDLDVLDKNYDAVTALGSLHHAPLDVIREEVSLIKKHLCPGGRWLQLAYPKARWVREGSKAFDEWGEFTDGVGTPWAEYLDREKLEWLFNPTPIKILFECEWYSNQFNWFDVCVGE